MKKMLQATKKELYYYNTANVKIKGANPLLQGDCSGLRGDFDLCKISEEERTLGINIKNLIDDEK